MLVNKVIPIYNNVGSNFILGSQTGPKCLFLMSEYFNKFQYVSSNMTAIKKSLLCFGPLFIIQCFPMIYPIKYLHMWLWYSSTIIPVMQEHFQLIPFIQIVAMLINKNLRRIYQFFRIKYCGHRWNNPNLLHLGLVGLVWSCWMLSYCSLQI